MFGTKIKGQPASQLTEGSTIWKQQPIVAKPVEEINLEAEVEQKRKNTFDVREASTFTG